MNPAHYPQRRAHRLPALDPALVELVHAALAADPAIGAGALRARLDVAGWRTRRGTVPSRSWCSLLLRRFRDPVCRPCSDEAGHDVAHVRPYCK